MEDTVLELPSVPDIDPRDPAPRDPIKKEGWASKEKIDWGVFAFIIGFHLACIAAFFTFSWSAVFVCLGLHWLTACLGITLCYHRLLTHRSFEVPKPLEYFLAIIGCVACQAGPIKWVATHRLHHAYSDREADPHSPLRGFFWAHMSWVLHKNEKYLGSFERYSRLAPDLAKDPVHVFISKTHILWTVLLAIGLYAWGGWPFVVWGIFVRTVLVYHTTWLVNSAAHIWGYRNYKTDDQSTNLWWVALITYGEGWHNNHHAFQYSARHGLKWWEFDLTYAVIQSLQALGLAKKIKLPAQNKL